MNHFDVNDFLIARRFIQAFLGIFMNISALIQTIIFTDLKRAFKTVGRIKNI